MNNQKNEAYYTIELMDWLTVHHPKILREYNKYIQEQNIIYE